MEKMECTVIIPTYNRPMHLKRILHYYHQYGNGLPILIADSSLEECKKLNKETVASLHDTSFLLLDKYSSNISGYHKILDALKYVSTKYCLLCADDDFVTPDGIQKSANFLDLNPEFVSAYGNHIWFSLRYRDHGKTEFTYKYYESQAYTQEDPKERLLHKAMDSSFITAHAVQSTAFMQFLIGEGAKIASDLQFIGAFRQTPDLFFAELLLFWLPPIYGKMQCLDSIYYMREDCTPQDLSRVYITLPDLMNEQSYEAKLHEFFDCLEGHLSKQTGIDLGEARKIAEKAIAVYKRETPSFVLAVNSIMGKLCLPSWLDLTIRKVYRAGSAIIYPHIGSGHGLPPKYNHEMDKVRLSILSSAEEVYGLRSK